MAEAETEAAGEPKEAAPVWPGWLVATAICIRFYSRLPVPRLPGEVDIHALPDFRLIPRALPFAALVIALPAAVTILVVGLADLASPLAATLAVTALVLTAGALHEDGLADSADGLFGGQTPERRLEIMKDSRVGSYGALALGLSLLLRVTALAAILDAAGAWAVAGAILIAAMWSRAEGVRLLAGQPPARMSGAAAAVGRPTRETGWIALTLSVLIGFGLQLATSLPAWGLAFGLGLASLAATYLARLSRRLIGGQTGDIIGAAQQLGEIAIYLGFAVALGAAR
jgi:adenosylcobinamide-GDP ribazoletransferase